MNKPIPFKIILSVLCFWVATIAFSVKYATIPQVINSYPFLDSFDKSLFWILSQVFMFRLFHSALLLAGYKWPRFWLDGFTIIGYIFTPARMNAACIIMLVFAALGLILIYSEEANWWFRVKKEERRSGRAHDTTKKRWIALTLLALGGGLGLHRWYLGKKISAVVLAVLTLFNAVVMLVGGAIGYADIANLDFVSGDENFMAPFIAARLAICLVGLWVLIDFVLIALGNLSLGRRPNPDTTDSQPIIARDTTKKRWVALTLLVFGGGLGLHRWYLGKKLSAAVLAALSLLAFAITVMGVIGYADLENLDFESGNEDAPFIVARLASFLVGLCLFIDFILIALGNLSLGRRPKPASLTESP